MIHTLRSSFSQSYSTTRVSTRFGYVCSLVVEWPKILLLCTVSILCLGGCGGDESPESLSLPTATPVQSAKSGEINSTNPDETVVAAWDGHVVTYAEIRDSMGKEIESISGQIATNPQLAKLFSEELKNQLNEVMRTALIVEEGRARGIQISVDEIEQTIAQLKAKSRNEEQFRRMVHGAAGEALYRMVENQLLKKQTQAAVIEEVSATITEEVKRAYYDENLETKFTRPHYTEGRRFLVEISSTPKIGIEKDLLRLVQYAVSKAESEKTVERVRDIIQGFDEIAFKSMLGPAPDLYRDEVIERLRAVAMEIVPIALEGDGNALLAAAEERMPRIYECFVGRNEAEARARAEMFRTQAADLLSAATDTESRDDLFKPFIEEFSEDMLVPQNLANVNIYHRQGPDGPTPSFGREFMETARVTPEGELSPVARTHNGYGFMLVRMQQPEYIVPYEDSTVQLHIPKLIQQEGFEEWLDNLYREHNAVVYEELIDALIQLEFVQPS